LLIAAFMLTVGSLEGACAHKGVAVRGRAARVLAEPLAVYELDVEWWARMTFPEWCRSRRRPHEVLSEDEEDGRAPAEPGEPPEDVPRELWDPRTRVTLVLRRDGTWDMSSAGHLTLLPTVGTWTTTSGGVALVARQALPREAFVNSRLELWHRPDRWALEDLPQPQQAVLRVSGGTGYLTLRGRPRELVLRRVL
jgi:hypothetical protein